MDNQHVQRAPLSSGSALKRRDFVRTVGLGGLLFATGKASFLGPSAERALEARLRAAVIGHTKRGDFGHDIDLVFNGRDNIEVVAVADPDPAGRARAVSRCRALRSYDDYLEMLSKEKPQLVAIAPRWTIEHHKMAMAALKAGAHLLTEKPFTTTLVEADEVLAAAEAGRLKIAVAHQMRLAPGTLELKQALAGGLIGDLLEIRAWGKQDNRAGGEDMMVLGTHLFDLIRFFAGDALWCTARVLNQGRDLARQDARRATEGIGPVAGDEIHAQFAFTNGVNATFVSRKRLQERVGHWGLEFVGSKASVRLLADMSPALYLLEEGKWESPGRGGQWRRWEGDPSLKMSAEERGFGLANKRVVDDWLDAIRENREPVCSGRAAMKAIEMVMAVYWAALTGARAPLPLAQRQHPLPEV